MGLVLVGVGLGGFVDGIVLHQLLQWHHLVSARVYPDDLAALRRNVIADGVFHAGAWVVVLIGVLVLVASSRRVLLPPVRQVLGLLLVGWGLFNLVEGLVNHQLLGVHHVRDDLGAPPAWDLGFLAVSVLLLVAGLLLARRPAGAPALPDAAPQRSR
jgi:uncharacterized membrane protein